MRSSNQPFPESRFARWALSIAWLALPVLVVAVLLTRSGQIAHEHGMVLVGLGAGLALVALAVASVAGSEIWTHGYRGLALLFQTSMIAALALAYPAYLSAKAFRLPPITDIATDVDDAPAFSNSAAARLARGGWQPALRDAKLRSEQLQAYPALRTIVLESEGDEAWPLIIDAVRALKWTIIEEIPIDKRSGMGRIEASAETPLMKFRHEITIRVRSKQRETRVDIRSVSRTGRHDLGDNASLIAKFTEELANPRE